jgi:hypothetical protein
MLRSVGFILLACIFSAQIGLGQTMTKETRKSVVREEGDTTTVESVILAKSEDITPRTEMFIVNPLKFLLFYNLSYYHRVSSSIVFGGGVQFPTPEGVDGFGLNAELRYYPSLKSPRGFYIAPNVSYNIMRSGGEEANPFSIGALIGWQWFPGDDFALGMGIGADYYSGSLSEQGGEITEFNGWAPALRFDIGYAW